MVMLVSLEQASNQVRRDSTDDDADLELKVHAASRMVLNYLKKWAKTVLPYDSAGDIMVDSSGLVDEVPEEVQMATLYLVGILYRDRDGQDVAAWDLGYLPKPVISMLYPLRDPAMA